MITKVLIWFARRKLLLINTHHLNKNKALHKSKQLEF